jgi:hypothetical protein
MKRAASALIWAGLASIASADIHTSTFYSGRSLSGGSVTDLMTLDILVGDIDNTNPPTATSLYLAVLMPNGQLLFHDGKQLRPYDGKAGAVFQTTTQRGEHLRLEDWNVAALFGAQVYVGYGNSFQQMLDRTQYKAVATIQANMPTARQDRVVAENAMIYCAPADGATNTLYFAYVINNRSYNQLSAIDYQMTISADGLPDSADNTNADTISFIFGLPMKQATYGVQSFPVDADGIARYRQICDAPNRNAVMTITAAYNLAGNPIPSLTN